MDGYLIKLKEKVDMLKSDNYFKILLSILFLNACGSPSTEGDSREALDFSRRLMGTENYNVIYKSLNDSIENWCLNKLMTVEGPAKWRYKIDSLMAFNSTGDRFISCLLINCTEEGCTQDDIEFMYGEKINSIWYFFMGEWVTLPREYYQKDIHTPLSFEKMHEIALKEVYRGYLIKKLFGSYEINDAWVNAHFEGVGWCTTCKTRADYEKVHLEKVKNNWYWRDTTNVVN